MFKESMQKFGCKVLAMSAFSFAATSVQAQNQAAIELPEAPLKEYRVESQYGPNVGILQPIFARENKVSIGLGGSYQSLSSLYDSYGASVSGMYHINHRHAIEPLYFNYQKSSNSNFVNSQVAPGNGNLSLSLPKYIYSASYFYTPYYSKMHIGYSTVAHFDFYFGAGLAYVANDEILLNGKTNGTSNAVGGSLTTGMRFLFQPRFGLRFELRDFIYKSQDFGGSGVVNNLNLAMSFEMFFGSFSGKN